MNRKIVVDGEILTKVPDCGWQIIYRNKKTLFSMAMDFSSCVRNANENNPCILVPFGANTLGFSVTLGENYVDLDIRYELIGENRKLIALLIYVGVEIIRTGLYESLFTLEDSEREYFERVRSALPDNYEVRIRGEYVSLDVDAAISLAHKLMSFSSSNMKTCFSCPLMNVCPSPPDPFNVKSHGSMVDVEELVDELDIEETYQNIYRVLLMEGMDPLLLLSMDILYEPVKIPPSPLRNGIRHVLKALNLSPHVGYIENFGNEFFDFQYDRIHILDRRGLRTVPASVPKLRRYKIYCRFGDITPLLLARTIARDALLGFGECRELEKYLDRFGKEKELIYMAMLGMRYPWKREDFVEEIPTFGRFGNITDAYLISTNHRLKLESTVLSSRAYREGLIEIFNSRRGYVLGATGKLLREVYRLCGGDAQ